MYITCMQGSRGESDRACASGNWRAAGSADVQQMERAAAGGNVHDGGRRLKIRGRAAESQSRRHF